METKTKKKRKRKETVYSGLLPTLLIRKIVHVNHVKRETWKIALKLFLRMNTLTTCIKNLNKNTRTKILENFQFSIIGF